MKIFHPPDDLRKRSLLKIASYAGIATGAIVLICVLSFLFFPDPLVNRFVKPRITKAFTEAYPAYSLRIADMNYNVLKNRFGFDSVALNAVDGTFSGSMGSFSVNGIKWIHLLWGGNLEYQDFANAGLMSQEILLSLTQSHYVLHCKRLSVSVADSEIVVEDLKYHPPGDDEQFFAESKFRTTRFRLVVPHARVIGLSCLEMLQGERYCARSIQINDVTLDALVNRDKPSMKDTSSPFMPNEFLSSIKELLRIDNLSITNGRLKYAERFEVGARPAWITFDNMQMLAEGIVNQGTRGAAVYVHAQFNLANAGTMKLLMSIPIASPEFSFQYSGSLNSMDLSALNSFLEVSDQMRIKTGALEGVTFEVNFASGRASGNVRGTYRDLSIAAIDKYTRSEKGLSNGIVSWIANTFKLNKNNVPDKSGSIRVGTVKYTRQRDDSFIQVVWYSLRTGVQNVAGF
jgi:hypothetical protein